MKKRNIAYTAIKNTEQILDIISTLPSRDVATAIHYVVNFMNGLINEWRIWDFMIGLIN